MANIFPIDFEEKLTMAQDDYILFSDSEDWNKIKKAQYKNLKWEKGDTGTAATITVWSTTTWAAWSSASVTNSWTSSAAVLDFTIPKGDKWDTGQTWPAIVSAAFNWNDIDFTEEDWNVVTLTDAKIDLKWDKWDAATVSVWTTSTLPAWSSATVTNSWTSSAAVFNFWIPKGDKWDTWNTWATGNWIASITSSKAWKITTVTITETNSTVDTFQISDWADWQWSWDVLWPNSSTDGDLVGFDGATWKLIKDLWINASDLNVKTFKLSSTSDLTTAQAAADYLAAGNNPLIIYSNRLYAVQSVQSAQIRFTGIWYSKTDASVTYLGNDSINFIMSSWTVTQVNTWSESPASVLRTWYNYPTPYSPEYNGSPATKKYVDDKVAELMGLGKFLSLWDATTWQPISFPLETPYTYSTWDYFLVETISSATPPVNYKPTGSSYTGTASSTAETEELAVGDIYIYDWTTWLLQLNHWKTVSFSEIAGSPSDNTALSNALWDKQDALTLPATPTQWHLVTWWADNETLEDGWAVPTVPTNVSSFVNDAGYLTSETVVSGDSWTTYTIKVANSEPWAWTPATTITFVTA